MNIALIGYGRMGREIEALASTHGTEVIAKFDIENNRNGSALNPESLKKVEVCIDFSTAAAVLTNLSHIAKCGKNLVIGTTGWYDKIDEAKKIVQENKIGLVHSVNFSIGVNVFMKLIERAGKILERFEGYDVSVEEIHHKDKLDSPSGTALEIGRILLQIFAQKKELLTGNPVGKIRSEEMQISSRRIGSFPGIHTVTFDSLADTIELKHTAKNRMGFARGALLAARWIRGKRGFYSMEDVLREMLPEQTR